MSDAMILFAYAFSIFAFGVGYLAYTGIVVGIQWYREVKANRRQVV